MIAQIPKQYKPLFSNDFLFYVYYGGRGGGKTENIAQSLVLLAMKSPLRILCIRESQSSLAESVMNVIEKWIIELNLIKHFRITGSSIKCDTGSEFIFMGMRSSNAVNVKSITGINITWIEEAEAFSKRSWDLLVPSVIRTDNPKIIISFNPYKDDDIIYKEFIVNKPPKNSLITKINYMDNPFFKNTPLEMQRQDDYERLSQDEYKHRWLGELVKYSEDSLFKDANFNELNIVFDDDLYIKKVIACDPATTNKDYSNEYGVVILGKTKEGIIHIIDDFSGNYSPLEFVSAVHKAKLAYNCNNVVVEVNNGGDFIKSALIQFDPTFNVIEVRAGADKIQRALPVANLMSVNKVRFIRNLTKLARQMRLLTIKGFKGANGESPDRLDAMVWGVYELAEIKTHDTINSVFINDWFKQDNDFLEKATLIIENVNYTTIINNYVVCVSLSVYKKVDEIKILITDSTITKEPFKTENLSIIDIPINQGLQGVFIEPINEKDLDIKVRNILPYIKQNKIMISDDIPTREFNNINAKIINTEITEFKFESEKIFYTIPLLCDIVYTEMGVSKK